MQFTLCPSEALSQEQRTVDRIVQELTNDEQNRREYEIRYTQDKNNNITKQNAKDQEDYQRSMQEYHK